MNPWIIAAALVVIPCAVLMLIVVRGTAWDTHQTWALQCAWRGNREMLATITQLSADKNQLQAERDRLWLLVYWSVGTTEAALSMSDEYGADEEDVSDAQEKVQELREAIGLDPEKDSWEQDPGITFKVEQERGRTLARLHNLGGA